MLTMKNLSVNTLFRPVNPRHCMQDVWVVIGEMSLDGYDTSFLINCVKLVYPPNYNPEVHGCPKIVADYMHPDTHVVVLPRHPSMSVFTF